MLAWISKNREVPEPLKGFPLQRQDSMRGTIYRLKGCSLPNPSTPVIIPINDNLSVFKVIETANPLLYAKPKQIGSLIDLAEGSWLAPVLRAFPDGTELPRRLMLTEKGESYEVKTEHLKAWSLGEPILYSWLSGEIEPTTAELTAAVATILQINYWITEIDLKVFGIISTDTILPFFEKVVDWQTRLDFVNSMSEDDKKKLLPDQA